MLKFSTICNECRILQVNTPMHRRVVVLLLILLSFNRLLAQTCTTLGQTPATAFPVCGTNTFSQANVPICETRTIIVPGCQNDGTTYTDKNPFWYRFTCFATGTLGFLITPNNLSSDYDWMLYDITNRNADDVFNNPSWVVSGNWSGNTGVTGTNNTATGTVVCGTTGVNPNPPIFSKMPTLQEGRTYLLLVSHFTNSQSGYTLSFGGGTAVITDPKPPGLQSASAACGGTILRVKLNKKMKCNSLAADGSDFVLAPAAGNIVSAVGVGCNSGFDMDSVILTVSGVVAPGTYSLNIRKGSDGNTLKDNCDQEIAEGVNLPVTVFPLVPTPMNRMKPVSCAPDEVELLFGNGMRCNSIAADGSDFVIPGLPVGIKGAAGTCTNGLTTSIKIQFTAPIQVAGNWTIQLRQGNDGNTIIDECGMPTPAGSALNFQTWDTVNADFTYNVLWGCKKDTVQFFHPGGNGVNSWQWNFDDLSGSQDQNPVFIFPTFGAKNISLAVNNGVCADSTTAVVLLDNAMDARFSAPEYLCPEDPAIFVDSSMGKIINWDWTFGNGNISTQQKPEPQRYKRPATRTQLVTVRLIVENDKNCLDTAYQRMEVVNSCYITVPSAFSPNGDSNNDDLYPLNAFKATDLEFKVYNRYGQLVFETKDWKKHWDGTFNGQKQPTGTYVWVLQFTHVDTKQKFFQKGATTLIR